MKIQKGIVKYKDRSDIVCAYGLTDDGKQYYFLDDTDTKKFSNGNRIVTSALVEAIDSMVKAKNVGVIDENGVVVVPLENRTIRPVNDNVIVVEKAIPTSPSVLQAEELRNDPAFATKLVSTPATIKDRLNAQMGVEGKYIFNDQFSEATICDINGSNLVNGELYSFISMANDKLYMSKNTVDSPIYEFSLSTYELLEPTVADAIDVSSAVVDTNVVEGALNSQNTAPAVSEAVPADVSGPVVGAGEDASAMVDAQPVVPSAENVSGPVVGAGEDASAMVDAQPVVPSAENVSGPEGEATPESGFAMEKVASAPVPPVVAGETVPAAPMGETVPVAEENVPVAEEGMAASGTEETVSETVAAANEGFNPSEISATDIPVADESDLPGLNETSEQEMNNSFENAMDNNTSTPIDPVAVAAAVGATTENNDTAPLDDEKSDIAGSITESLSGLDEADSLPIVEENDDSDNPPIVEEESMSGFEEIDVASEKTTEEDAVAIEDEKNSSDENAELTDSQESSDEEEAQFSDNVTSSKDEPFIPEDDEDDFEPIPMDDERTSAVSVPIDADTVLSTVDRNGNGIIDSSEVMSPSRGSSSFDEPASPLERAYESGHDVSSSRDNYGYASTSLPSYGLDYGKKYSSALTDVKPDRIVYDDFSMSAGKDNIMSDVAKSMSELMRQNKEQRGVITQYRERVEGLEAQNRILSEKYKDQSARYESLSSKLRGLDEATARVESRNQLLESRIRDQEKIIASQDRELKILRPQIEGKKDLVRLLADARTLLGTESSYGYSDDDEYYRRAA